MSTRALYTFTDNDQSFNVYKHHDGYPSGAAQVLTDMKNHFIWVLPRFEADEAAAGFCAAGKANRMIQLVEASTPAALQKYKKDTEAYDRWGRGGGVRLMPQGKPLEVAAVNCGDIEFRYEIMVPPGNKDLHIKAYAIVDVDGKETLVFEGALADFTAWSAKEKAVS